MARIRSIKPEFPQSETIGALSRDARLLFIQLWTIVDDDGRARAASRMLASLLYPYDNDAAKLMPKWLDELEAAKCIRRYVVEASSYLEIINWLKHQKIDHPSKSRLPTFEEDSRNLASPRDTLAPDLGPRTIDQDEERKKESALRAPPAPTRGRKPSAKVLLADEWRPDAPLTTHSESELEKMRDWARSNAIRKADWDATFRNWLRRASEINGKTGNNYHAQADQRPTVQSVARRLVEEFSTGGGAAEEVRDGGEVRGYPPRLLSKG